MKINERSLVRYANSNSAVDKEGYLLKKGELNKGSQRRWFVLKGNLLFYYERRQDREPIGLVILEGCTIELAQNNMGLCTFQVVFPGAGLRTYELSAKNQEQMESWMKALTCASYDYLRMVVTELQRRLEEASENENRTLVRRGRVATSILTDTQTLAEEMLNVSVSPAGLRGNSCSAGAGQGRFNPFNAVDGDRDTPALASSNSTEKPGPFTNSGSHSTEQQRSAKPRNFLEMHKEFGSLLSLRAAAESERDKDVVMPLVS